MITVQKLSEIFKAQELTFFTGVPDSTFKEWMSFLAEENGNGITNRIAAIERDAIGWAAGYHVSTGKIPVVYLQNSGLGNIINPLTSLTDPEVYNIPLLLMIGWRGEPGTKDEPQHIKMGKVTLPLLETLGIGYDILPDNWGEAEKTIIKAVGQIKETGKPFAIIIKSGILEEDKEREKDGSNLEMTREEAIKIIVDLMDGREVIVSTTGKTSRELFEYRETKKTGHQRDFLMVGSMGLASSFGAEIALQKPGKKVFIFDGDGALIMSAGALPTIGFYSPKNLFHIVFDNASYDSTGGQQTVSSIIDFEKVALANGYKGVLTAQIKEELGKCFSEMVLKEGPQMLIVRVKKGARKDLGRPTTTPVGNKESFIRFLAQGERGLKYYLPTQIIWGRWEEEIKNIVDSFAPKNILFISSKAVSGTLSQMRDCLSGYKIAIFEQVTSNPSPEIVEQAQSAAIGADLIIGLGGGSVMDVAKVVASNLKKPCLEIPTTAGTGSEITPFAALYTDKKKESLTPGFPTVALVDWRLSITMPKELTASSGLDALSQAIEAFWSIYSTPLTDIHAKKAIELAFGNLEKAYQGDEGAKEMMSLAALEAGRAFSQTKTTAVHSVSYPFSVFYKIPHGFACALTLPYFLIYNSQIKNSDCLDNRGSEFVKKRIGEIIKLLGAESAEEAKEKILGLMQRINAPLKTEFDTELIVANGFSPERVANNPRKVTEEGLRGILRKIKLEPLGQKQVKAVILASGIAKRLRPLTKKIPKALVDLGKETILERIINSLKENGIKNLIITTGYLEESIKDYIAKKYPELDVVYVNNPLYEKTNYIYSLCLAKEAIGDDDIILLHADMVFEPELLKRIVSQEKSGALVKRELPYPEKDFKASIVNGLINKVGVKIEGEMLKFLAPIYKFKNADFKTLLAKMEQFIKEGKTNCYAEDAFNEISDKIELHPVYFDNEFCMEVDDFDDLEKARSYFKS
jgi:phosphonopyruvate decarboxylase